jgi:hypothetical protein
MCSRAICQHAEFSLVVLKIKCGAQLSGVYKYVFDEVHLDGPDGLRVCARKRGFRCTGASTLSWHNLCDSAVLVLGASAGIPGKPLLLPFAIWLD